MPRACMFGGSGGGAGGGVRGELCLQLRVHSILGVGGEGTTPLGKEGVLRKEKTEHWINGSQGRIKLPGARWRSQGGDSGSWERSGQPCGDRSSNGKWGVMGQRREGRGGGWTSFRDRHRGDGGALRKT